MRKDAWWGNHPRLCPVESPVVLTRPAGKLYHEFSWMEYRANGGLISLTAAGLCGEITRSREGRVAFFAVVFAMTVN